MRNVSNFGKGEPTAHTFWFDKNHYLSEGEMGTGEIGSRREQMEMGERSVV
jgi:hypothetical protein